MQWTILVNPLQPYLPCKKSVASEFIADGEVFLLIFHTLAVYTADGQQWRLKIQHHNLYRGLYIIFFHIVTLRFLFNDNFFAVPHVHATLCRQAVHSSPVEHEPCVSLFVHCSLSIVNVENASGAPVAEVDVERGQLAG